MKNNQTRLYGPYSGPGQRDPFREIQITYSPSGGRTDQYDQFLYHQPPHKGGVFSFSRREIQELIISIGVLTFAFAMALGRPNGFLKYLGPSFIAVFTGFFLHEMGHKFVSQNFGIHSEFRMSQQGLLLALLTSFAGFLIAAPGAVMIYGYPTSEQSGKTSFAGPMVNVIIALIAFPFVFLDGVVSFTAELVMFINAFLALFNLIPVHPLDGKKILNWSKTHYALLVIIALSLFINGIAFL